MESVHESEWRLGPVPGAGQQQFFLLHDQVQFELADGYKLVDYANKGNLVLAG